MAVGIGSDTYCGVRRLIALAFLIAVSVTAYQLGRRTSSGPAVEQLPDQSDHQALQVSALVDSLRKLRLDALRRITRSDTYIPAMLAQSDSVLKRWSVRISDPLRIHPIEEGAPGYSVAMGQEARNAFARWERVADIPVSFVFVRDSSRAEVVVRWIEKFSIERAGQADVRWDRRGILQQGTLTLATHTPRGQLMLAEAIYTVALHEIGHILGLGHSDDPRDVMYPTTDVHDIAQRDRRNGRLLYALPAGSLKLPRVGP